MREDCIDGVHTNNGGGRPAQHSIVDNEHTVTWLVTTVIKPTRNGVIHLMLEAADNATSSKRHYLKIRTTQVVIDGLFADLKKLVSESVL